MDNGSQPATKQDLADLQDDLVETVRDSETKLLNAFCTFAQSNQQRMAQNEGNTTAVISRLATLESRVTQLEKRLNLPPAT